MSKCLDKVDEVLDEMEAIALRGMIRKVAREEMAAMRIVKCGCLGDPEEMRRCSHCGGSGYVIKESRG